MNEAEAATFLGFSRASLTQWRHRHTPGQPPYMKLVGKIRYSRKALVAWMAASEVVH
jgi:hypothetical protein